MLLAAQTKQAINDALQADQGAKFRGLLQEILPTIKDAYRTEEDGFRSHLGASVIGQDCARAIWYGFHWTTKSHFDGRILRLFNRGHLEEARFIALLRMIGVNVWAGTEDGKQINFKSHDSHAGGSLDAMIRGLPEDPTVPMTAEFKTHGDKSFNDLVKQGVRSAKWEHFVQVQIGMGRMGITRCLYMAVNKNTDELHCEIVDFDQEQFDKYDLRTRMIVETSEPPPKIHDNPSWFRCKFCDHRPVCHGVEMPAVNCRTCKHVQIAAEASWKCFHPNALMCGGPATLSTAQQNMADTCPGYTPNPVFKNKV